MRDGASPTRARADVQLLTQLFCIHNPCSAGAPERNTVVMPIMVLTMTMTIKNQTKKNNTSSHTLSLAA